MSLALPAAYTDRELTGTDAGVLRRTKPALHNPILQRMKGDNAKPSSRLQYIDHRINSIQNYISAKTRNMYNMIDVNVYQENIFHTKMMLKEFDLDNYLFGITESELSDREIKQIKHQLKQEMMEIFYGRNLPSVKA